MSDYRYCLPLDVWVGDDHLIDARDMPDELRPADHVELVDVELVRDDDGQVIGAWVHRDVEGILVATGEPVHGTESRWIPVA